MAEYKQLNSLLFYFVLFVVCGKEGDISKCSINIFENNLITFTISLAHSFVVKIIILSL